MADKAKKEYKTLVNMKTVPKEVLKDVAKACGVASYGTKEEITKRINIEARKKKPKRTQVSKPKQSA